MAVSQNKHGKLAQCKGAGTSPLAPSLLTSDGKKGDSGVSLCGPQFTSVCPGSESWQWSRQVGIGTVWTTASQCLELRQPNCRRGLAETGLFVLVSMCVPCGVGRALGSGGMPVSSSSAPSWTLVHRAQLLLCMGAGRIWASRQPCPYLPPSFQMVLSQEVEGSQFGPAGPQVWLAAVPH